MINRVKDLEERKTTGLAAMDQLAALAAEKEAALRSASESGLSVRAFAVFWTLRVSQFEQRDPAHQQRYAVERFLAGGKYRAAALGPRICSLLRLTPTLFPKFTHYRRISK